jgi:hypothetical protein
VSSETDPLMQHRTFAKGLVCRMKCSPRVQVVGAAKTSVGRSDEKPEQVLGVNEPPCGWLTGSLRSAHSHRDAGELAGCDHHTVASWVGRRDAEELTATPAPRRS